MLKESSTYYFEVMWPVTATLTVIARAVYQSSLVTTGTDQNMYSVPTVEKTSCISLSSGEIILKSPFVGITITVIAVLLLLLIGSTLYIVILFRKGKKLQARS